MINGYDCVTISDDETPAQVAQAHKASLNRKRKRDQNDKIKNTTAIETIIIDEESQFNNRNDNNNIIELPDSQNSVKDEPLEKLHRIHTDDPLFSDYIEKCLDLENSDGMIRIVNKTLLKVYEECDVDYKKSSEFRRVLQKALRQLDIDPDHKFSHVKDMVETLKLHKYKKRAQLTTLATNLKENHVKKKIYNSKIKNSCIVLDSDDEIGEVPINNIEDQNEVIVLDEKNTEEEKENCGQTKENGVVINHQDNFLVPRVEIAWEPAVNMQENQILPIEYEPLPPSIDSEKIKKLESQIAWCKERITQLEETEVDEDSVASPYILCEKNKEQVVKLYEQLCQLTGDQPIKRRKVRLQLLEGHPPQPVRRLEAFINDNIGEDGNPLFPDFCDVVKCVMAANIEDKLGWKKQQVMREANSLFMQCGRALQKQRQRREYRDLLSRVKVEAPEYDPADQDPELLRRLEENRKVGVKRENDLLERYVQLQYLPTQKQKSGPSLEISNEETPFRDIDKNQSLTIQTQKPEQISVANEQILNGNEFPEQSETMIEEAQPSPNSELISDEDSNFEPPEVKLSQEKTDVHIEDDKKVKIKQEPIDVVQLLEDLGDDYTVSVIDLEDPHLVIEISSDESSDEEIHVEGETDTD